MTRSGGAPSLAKHVGEKHAPSEGRPVRRTPSQKDAQSEGRPVRKTPSQKDARGTLPAIRPHFPERNDHRLSPSGVVPGTYPFTRHRSTSSIRPMFRLASAPRTPTSLRTAGSSKEHPTFGHTSKTRQPSTAIIHSSCGYQYHRSPSKVFALAYHPHSREKANFTRGPNDSSTNSKNSPSTESRDAASTSSFGSRARSIRPPSSATAKLTR